MKSVTRKRCAPEFKAQAVSLVGMGKPFPEVAQDLEIGTSILYGRLRREVANLKLGDCRAETVFRQNRRFQTRATTLKLNKNAIAGILERRS